MKLTEYINKRDSEGWDYKVRPYQLDAMQALNSACRSLDNSMLVLPTGGGKTATAMIWLAWILKQKPDAKALWIVHREKLIDQAIGCLKSVESSIGWSKWTAKTKSLRGQIVFAMMLSSRRESAIHNQHFDIVIIDEGHMLHTGNNTYQILFNDNITYKFILGLTATPLSPKLELDITFNNIAYQVLFTDLVKQGYLSKPQYVRYKTGIEWKGATRSTGLADEKDFTDADLKALNSMDRNDMIVQEYVKHQDRYGKTVLFAIDINHAEQLTEEFKKAGVKTGMLVSGMPDKEKKETLERLDMDEGEDRVDVLINIMILTEGWDMPKIHTVFLCRPTASERLYMQMIGRGSRLYEAYDNKFWIVDFVDQCNKYALAAEEWALKSFEAKPDPDLVLEHSEREKKELVDRLADRLTEEFGMSKSIKARLTREFMNIDGVLTFSNMNAKMRNRKTVITKRQRIAIDKLYNLLLSNTSTLSTEVFSDWVDISHQQCVSRGRACEFNIRQWRSIAWGMHMKYIQKMPKIPGSQNDTTFRYTKIELE